MRDMREKKYYVKKCERVNAYIVVTDGCTLLEEAPHSDILKKKNGGGGGRKKR